MITVIGCGNPNRQDDGVGPEVIRQLKTLGLDSENVKLLDAGTDGLAVMFAARGSISLIIVDASKSGSEPGALFEVPGDQLHRSYVPSLNLHDFRWDNALYAGRQIYKSDFPTDVSVFLIEAENLDLGIGLSDSVSRAAGIAVEKISALITLKLASQNG
jgi:hydrogenase maturation protease